MHDVNKLNISHLLPVQRGIAYFSWLTHPMEAIIRQIHSVSMKLCHTVMSRECLCCLLIIINEKLMKKLKLSYCWISSKIQWKIVKRGKLDINNTQIHDHSLSRLGTGISVNSGDVNLIVLALTLWFKWEAGYLKYVDD
jgi:hypothetical protein